MRRAAAVMAWVCLVYVAFATLSPIEMRMSINSEIGSILEHFGAFLVIALLLGISYPRRALIVLTFAVGCVLILEVLQLVVPGRHARLSDAAVKCAGAISGWLLAYWIVRHLPAQLVDPSKIGRLGRDIEKHRKS